MRMMQWLVMVMVGMLGACGGVVELQQSGSLLAAEKGYGNDSVGQDQPAALGARQLDTSEAAMGDGNGEPGGGAFPCAEIGTIEDDPTKWCMMRANFEHAPCDPPLDVAQHGGAFLKAFEAAGGGVDHSSGALEYESATFDDAKAAGLAAAMEAAGCGGAGGPGGSGGAPHVQTWLFARVGKKIISAWKMLANQVGCPCCYLQTATMNGNQGITVVIPLGGSTDHAINVAGADPLGDGGCVLYTSMGPMSVHPDGSGFLHDVHDHSIVDFTDIVAIEGVSF